MAQARSLSNKSFLLLFFKKEVLPSYLGAKVGVRAYCSGGFQLDAKYHSDQAASAKPSTQIHSGAGERVSARLASNASVALNTLTWNDMLPCTTSPSVIPAMAMPGPLR